MFSKKASAAKPDSSRSSNVPEVTPEPEPVIKDKTKTGPTPKRKVSEAANRVPLVPGDRRAAAKMQRERNKQLREKQYQAMQTGQEAALPARDKGPLKRYARNFVDARRNLGDYFLYIAGIFLVLMFVTAQFPLLTPIVTFVLYLLVFLAIADAWLMWRKLKAQLFEKFGPDADVKPVRWYSVMRVFQLRRARLPKPQVKYGEFPA